MDVGFLNRRVILNFDGLAFIIYSAFVLDVNLDKLVKSRHSGENRSPDALQLLEKTG